MARNLATSYGTTPITFRRKQNNPLNALLKLIQSERDEAVDTLIKGMKGDDIKLATTCAKQLLDYEIEISELVNKDQLTRLVAECKILGNNLGGSAAEEDTRPMIDFTTIQSTN